MAWVITIARNLCRMNLRKRSKFSEESVEDMILTDLSEPSPEDSTIIKACFGILGERKREVVIMHAAAGLKHREIAEILKLPLSTVISRYNRAVKKLMQEMKGAL